MSIIWLLTALKGWAYYRAHEPWAIGDWLINAAGGWVRRAICGEAFLHISTWTHTNPGFWVWLTQIVAYALFFASTYALIRRQSNLAPFVLLIFAPFTFTFQLHIGGYRKEILYFAALGISAWGFGKPWKPRHIRLWLATIIVAYTIPVLAHELLFAFLPYIVGLYAAASHNHLQERHFDWIDAIAAFGLVLNALALAFALTHSHASAQSVRAMEAALSAHGYPLAREGALAWLAYPTSMGIRAMLWAVLVMGYAWKYALLTALVLVAFLPLRKAKWEIPKPTLLMVKISWMLSLLAMLVMIDWGRMIYVHAVSMFIYALVFAKPAPHPQKLSWWKWAFVAVYAITWYLPPYFMPNMSPIFGLHWLKTVLQATV